MTSNLLNMFNRENTQEYKKSTDTHLLNVSYAISKFSVLGERIHETYGEVDEAALSKLEKKVLSLATNKSILKSLMKAERISKDSLADSMEQFLMSNEIDSIMKAEIKSKEQGLDYAIAVGMIDDYIDYLRSGVFDGPKTTIKV